MKRWCTAESAGPGERGPGRMLVQRRRSRQRGDSDTPQTRFRTLDGLRIHPLGLETGVECCGRSPDQAPPRLDPRRARIPMKIGAAGAGIRPPRGTE
jgi:hypothetical protein